MLDPRRFCDVLPPEWIMDTLFVNVPLRFSYDLEIHPHKHVNLHVAAIEDQMFDVMRQSDVTFTATGSKACGIMWGPARGFCKVSLNDLVWGKSTENHGLCLFMLFSSTTVFLCFLLYICCSWENPIIHFPLLQWGETRSHVYPRNSIISIIYIIYTVARSLTELPFTHRSTIGCG